MSEEEWRKWVPVADQLVLQAYYRTLGMVSMHAPIDQVYQAVQEISKTKRGGDIHWVPNLEGRVARWDNLEVYPGITTSLYVLGSPIRRKNTVYIRVGFWQSYILRAPSLHQLYVNSQH